MAKIGIESSPMDTRPKFLSFFLLLLSITFFPTILKSQPKRYAYDSSYVLVFRDKLHLSFILASRGSSVKLYNVDNKKESIVYSPNNFLNVGFGIDYKWISLETTFKIPGLDTRDPKKGNSSVGNLSARFIRQQFWISGQIQGAKGFYVANPQSFDQQWFSKNKNYPMAPNLQQFLIYVTGNYIFNHKKFSYKASVTQFHRQIKSAGSFILGGTLAIYGASNDSSFLPTPLQNKYGQGSNVSISVFYHYGINTGYLHTFVIKKKVFVHLGLIPSLGLKVSEVTYASSGLKDRESGLGFVFDTRLALGRNGDQSFYGIYINSLTLNDNFKERLENSFNILKLFYGIRL